jgi:hypothetical protein
MPSWPSAPQLRWLPCRHRLSLLGASPMDSLYLHGCHLRPIVMIKVLFLVFGPISLLTLFLSPTSSTLRGGHIVSVADEFCTAWYDHIVSIVIAIIVGTAVIVSIEVSSLFYFFFVLFFGSISLSFVVFIDFIVFVVFVDFIVFVVFIDFIVFVVIIVIAIIVVIAVIEVLFLLFISHFYLSARFP